MEYNNLKENFTMEKLNELEIDKYLTLANKKVLIDELIPSILKENESGIYIVDRYTKEMLLVRLVANWYGNIIFDGNEFTSEQYDFLMSSGTFDYIRKKCFDDYSKFKGMLNDTINDEIENRNSISAVINRLGRQLIEKLNDITDSDKMAKMVEQMKIAVDGNPELMKLLQLEMKGKKTKSPKKVK